MPRIKDGARSPEAPVLVCGLGSLGQACLLRLLPFDVPLLCLDHSSPVWIDPRLEERLGSAVVLGDMRLAQVLRRAGAHQARSVLLLGSDSTVNFEAALQVRLLNPTAEIVVRSTSRQASLGALLEERLPGIAVVDPLSLTAGAIAEALRPGNQRACFQLDGQTFVVLEGLCEDRRLQRPLRLAGASALEGQSQLLVTPMGLQPGRTDAATGEARTAGHFAESSKALINALRWLQQRSGLTRGISLGLIGLLMVGIVLFSKQGGWSQGLFVTLALLKGEYVDPVNVVLSQTAAGAGLDPWLIGGTLFYSLVGTMLTSALVAFILEWLLRENFGPARPGRLRRGSRRILLVEGGDLALQLAASLESRHLGVVRVDSRSDQPRPARGNLVYGRLEAALAALTPCRVEGIGLLSPDLLANLQGALELHRRWPGARLAVLAHAVEAAEQLGDLLGGVAVISTMDLVADAMVATAFGERVEEVCRIEGANLLLVRYWLLAGDTLCGRSIARIENGYNVTAVQLKRTNQDKPLIFPSGDLVLAAGDRLAVLGTLADLRSIENGQEIPPVWCVRLQGDPPEAYRFDAQQSLARHLGMAPGSTTHLLDGGEHLTPPLDRDSGEQLVRELRRLGIRCQLEPVGE